jgi:hypothetical protein
MVDDIRSVDLFSILGGHLPLLSPALLPVPLSPNFPTLPTATAPQSGTPSNAEGSGDVLSP